MSTLTGAPVPPAGDFVFESSEAIQNAQDTGLQFSEETIYHFGRLTKVLQSGLPEIDRILLAKVEDEIWSCITAYWNAAVPSGHQPADPAMVAKVRRTAIVWLAAIWFEILEYGSRQRERRPPHEQDYSR